MNEQNLRPVAKGEIRARELGHLGGIVRTPAKKYAARLRELRKKGMSDETVKKFTAMIEDSDSSSIEILMWLESIKKDCVNPYAKINLGNSFIAWQKMHHGEKIKSENLNVNLNIDMLKFKNLVEKYEKEEPEEKPKEVVIESEPEGADSECSK